MQSGRCSRALVLNSLFFGDGGKAQRRKGAKEPSMTENEIGKIVVDAVILPS